MQHGKHAKRDRALYLPQKSAKKMKKLKMLFVYQARSRIRIEQVIGGLLQYTKKRRNSAISDFFFLLGVVGGVVAPGVVSH